MQSIWNETDNDDNRMVIVLLMVKLMIKDVRKHVLNSQCIAICKRFAYLQINRGHVDGITPLRKGQVPGAAK